MYYSQEWDCWGWRCRKGCKNNLVPGLGLTDLGPNSLFNNHHILTYHILAIGNVQQIGASIQPGYIDGG